MMSFHPLTKLTAPKFVGSNLAWLLAISSLVLGHILAAAEDRTSTEPPSKHWLDRHVKYDKYKLSASETEGLYFCSVRGGKVLEIEFERGFVTVLFHADAPRFFKQSELSPALLAKLKTVQANESLDLLCVHSFYRDDWQARYDEARTVHHKLLDIGRARGTLDVDPHTIKEESDQRTLDGQLVNRVTAHTDENPR